MAYYNGEVDATERAFRRLRDARAGMSPMRNYGVMGLGAGDAVANAEADAAAAVAVATVDVVALQAEMDKLKKENEELKKSMAKFWAGAATGVVGSWAWRKWRNRGF